MRIREVGVGVSSAEIGGRHAILDRGRRESKRLDENATGIRAGDTVQAVKEDTKVRFMLRQEGLNEGEVEDRLEELDVVGD